MRIAQVSTLSAPVREDAVGSVESLVWLLTRELARLGHEVTVFGAAGAQVDGETVATLPGPYGAAGSFDDWQLCEWINLCRAVQESGRFDVVHTHAYLWGLPLEPFCQAPMVHSLHIVPDDNAARLWSQWPKARVIAISRQQWSAYPALHPMAFVPHGVDVAQFTFRETPQDYVCYLGRFVSGKGPIQAIGTAKALGLQLKLAGPESAYFRERVAPLVDGHRVEYVGYVEGRQRDELLGRARALLYPIQYPEAFGLVLVESMLCGTPVVGMRLGAVPEIIEEGVTGTTAASMEEFPHAVHRCLNLDRRRVRAVAESRFSAERMACDYLQAYQEAILEHRTNGPAAPG